MLVIHIIEERETQIYRKERKSEILVQGWLATGILSPKEGEVGAMWVDGTTYVRSVPCRALVL